MSQIRALQAPVECPRSRPRRRFLARALGAIALSVGTLAGCTPAAPPAATTADTGTNAATASPVALTISVAASVQDAMRDVQTAYQQEAPAVSITYNFGSSGSLAQQIAQGAPTDVFLSASQKWMDDLEEQGQILAESRQDLLQNAMVLIVPPGSDVTDFAALATAQVSRVAIGEPESVPAGRYAKEVLTTLGVFDSLQPKLVFGKDVRQVLSYVETGNVDVGLVYATDAQVSDQVQVVATAPAESHAPIVYPIAIVQDSEQVEAAQDFVAFLSSETAVAIFESYGFDLAE